MTTLNNNEERLAPEFEHALKLRDDGNLVAARRALELLIEKLQPADKRLLAHSHMQVGHIADMLGDQVTREVHFRRAVEIGPKLELASMGLFLALDALGRMDEAIDEMLRFLRLRYSELYEDLLCRDYEARLSAEQRRLVVEARQLLRAHRQN